MFRKFVSLALAAGIAAISLVTIQASPAASLCEFSYQSHLWNTNFGREDYRYASTCTGTPDGFYAGKLAEVTASNSDGLPAYFSVKVNGNWIVMQTASSLAWKNFNFQGTTGISYGVRLCSGSGSSSCAQSSLIGA